MIIYLEGDDIFKHVTVLAIIIKMKVHNYVQINTVGNWLSDD